MQFGAFSEIAEVPRLLGSMCLLDKLFEVFRESVDGLECAFCWDYFRRVFRCACWSWAIVEVGSRDDAVGTIKRRRCTNIHFGGFSDICRVL